MAVLITHDRDEAIDALNANEAIYRNAFRLIKDRIINTCNMEDEDDSYSSMAILQNLAMIEKFVSGFYLEPDDLEIWSDWQNAKNKS